MVRTRWFVVFMALVLILTLGQRLPVGACDDDDDPDEGNTGEVVDFQDANLAAAVRKALGIAAGDPIYSGRLERLTCLNAESKGIKNLSGLEKAIKLSSLNLGCNRGLSNISALAGLPLKELRLSNTGVSDFSPISDKSLQRLYLNDLGLQNIDFLSSLKQLTELEILNNKISDLSPLKSCTKLTRLYAGYNKISDIKPLIALKKLSTLKLWYNQISDVTPLLELKALNHLYIAGNPFSSSAEEVFAALRARGVSIDIADPNRVPVTGVTIAPTSITLNIGEQKKLSYSVQPKNASDKRVTWHTENAKIAKISDGKVTAVAVGTTRVKVMTKDGSKKAWCTVTVVDKTNVPVTGVSLNLAELSMAPGEKATLTATVTPADADNKKLKWLSDNEAVVTVKEGTVKAKKPGAAKITVKTVDGGHTATCHVIVSAPEVEEIYFPYTAITLLAEAEIKLELIKVPANGWAEWTWRSSDEEVATVSSSGKVKGIKAGTSHITVTNGKISAECIVNVAGAEETDPIKFDLTEEKNRLSIPKDILSANKNLDINHGDMQIIIPINAWLTTLKNMELDYSDGIFVEVEKFIPNVPKSLVAVSPAYSFSLKVDDFTVEQFADKLLLTLNYNPETVKNPDKLAIYWHNEETDTWDELPSLIDTKSATVSTLINHWSSFALLKTIEKGHTYWVFALLAILALNAITLIIVLQRQRRA